MIERLSNSKVDAQDFAVLRSRLVVGNRPKRAQPMGSKHGLTVAIWIGPLDVDAVESNVPCGAGVVRIVTDEHARLNLLTNLECGHRPSDRLGNEYPCWLFRTTENRFEPIENVEFLKHWLREMALAVSHESNRGRDRGENGRVFVKIRCSRPLGRLLHTVDRCPESIDVDPPPLETALSLIAVSVSEDSAWSSVKRWSGRGAIRSNSDRM